MEAAIIAIGTELLGYGYADTNSLVIAGALERYGVNLSRKYVLPDDEQILVGEIASALSKHDILITTGGLGPTGDDLTKGVFSRVLGIELVEDEGILGGIRKLFEERGLEMPEVNRRQAMIFTGQRVLANRRGTAPGFHLNVEWEGKARHIWILPGVPHELEGMIETEVEPWLSSASSQSIHRRIVRLIGMTESAVEEELTPFYRNHRDDVITIVASRGEVQIHLKASGAPDDAYPRLNAMERELSDIFGSRMFGLDDETLECVVGRLLSSRGDTISTAESCTGGLLSSRITDVSGSSAYFVGGAVAYSHQAKLFLIGVDPALIERHGEVSETVAREMAQGVRRRFQTTWGVGITGIAGPTGGTPKKPVGTVHVSVASRSETRHRQYLFAGSRELIKHYSTQMALNMVRLMILDIEE